MAALVSVGIENLLTSIGGMVLLFLLLGIVIYLIIWWIIFSKAGFSGILAFLMLIPLINIITFLVFIIVEWPIHREVTQLRQQLTTIQTMVQQQNVYHPGPSNPSYPNYPPHPY
jgi:predicted PurR-regulated permease PerM